ncbi:hypothetical protein [Morganella psychrotolerans]|nr:hypothetical protein [Morganella psychrotolerans]
MNKDIAEPLMLPTAQIVTSCFLIIDDTGIIYPIKAPLAVITNE